MKFNKEEVFNILAQRDPFKWVDEVEDCVPGKSVVASKYMSPDLDIYKGHFPNFPITPGVITIEAMAQAAGIALATYNTEGPRRIGFFAGIENARFRRKILPGSTIVLKCTIRDPEAHIVVADCEALVNDEVAATATISFSYGKKPVMKAALEG